MATPVISIIATASRPENWQDLYASIGENNVDYELVFVGPNPPQFQLWDNFTYIKSNVKPAQCLEIASRNASGELIMVIADDLLFTTARPMDSLYDAYVSGGDSKSNRVV